LRVTSSGSDISALHKGRRLLPASSDVFEGIAHQDLLDSRARALTTLRGWHDELAAQGKLSTPATRELWRLILHAAEHGAQTLNLSDCAMPLRLLNPKVMETLGALCCLHDPPTSKIRLPENLQTLPRWLRSFGSVVCLSVPEFKGGVLDAHRMQSLQVVEVENVRFDRQVRVRVPPSACAVKAYCADGEVARVTPSDVPVARFCDYIISARSVSLNCIVQFIDGSNIECRQFSLAMICEWGEEELRELGGVEPLDPLGVFDSPGKIADAAVPFECRDDHTRICQHAREAYVVSFGKWNDFVESRIGCAERAGKSAAHLLVNSSDHAMAQRLRLEAGRGWTLEWYDPNEEKTKSSHGPFDFSRDCPGEGGFDFYFPAARPGGLGRRNFVHVVVVHDALDPLASAAPNPREKGMSIEYLEAGDALDPEALARVLNAPYSEAASQLVRALTSAPAAIQRTAILANLDTACPSHIFEMMWFNHPESIPIFGRVLVDAMNHGAIGAQDVMELLLRQTERGWSALPIALRAEGHPECVERYCELLALLHENGTLSQAVVEVLMRGRVGQAEPHEYVISVDAARAYLQGASMLRKSGALPEQSRVLSAARRTLKRASA